VVVRSITRAGGAKIGGWRQTRSTAT
jgi:hypothetical protein